MRHVRKKTGDLKEGQELQAEAAGIMRDCLSDHCAEPSFKKKAGDLEVVRGCRGMWQGF